MQAGHFGSSATIVAGIDHWKIFNGLPESREKARGPRGTVHVFLIGSAAVTEPTQQVRAVTSYAPRSSRKIAHSSIS